MCSYQLELAQSLGWVSSGEEGAALKDAHLQDLSYQQAEAAGDDSTGSVKSENVCTLCILSLHLSFYNIYCRY